MLSQLIRTLKNLSANLLEETALAYFEPTLSAIVSILTIGTILIGGIQLCLRRFLTLAKQKPIDRLYKALIEHSVVSKAEVIYQVLSYQKPHFADQKTIRKLQRQIQECSGDKQSAAAVFSVIGAPACGKTTTMRYLYCQLSKSRKCVYFQMQDVVSMKKLSRYLGKQKAANYFEDRSSVVAFFDGLDEAYAFFREENPDSMEDAFKSIFFSGLYSKIHEAFQANKLNLDCIVVSLRPEFLERSQKSLTELQYKNISSRVFRILPMSNRDTIKVFKSLRILKKIEAKGSEEKKRHQKRYPPRWRAYHYIWMLRRILKENPDCLFRYPMYIRYAYAFMQEYEKRLGGKQRAFSSNIAVSFDILLDAIIKWEFHVYYENEFGGAAETKKEEFKKRMKQFSQAIILAIPENGTQNLPKDQFESIIQRFFPDELSRLAAAHCFMVSDDEGKYFTFCHRTFYEYFLARYLFEEADYKSRKARLFSETGSDNLRAMYYSILCQNEKLNAEISESTKYTSDGPMTLVSYQLLEKEGRMDIQDEPKISLVEILEYLPCIKSFQYREQEFTYECLEKLMDCGELDLQKTGWDSLDYAKGITPLVRIKNLNINGLPLRDVSALNGCCKLDYLEMRFQKEDDLLPEQILDQLSNRRLLYWIHIASYEGILCRQVYERISSGTLCVKRVFVKTPNYSKSHLEMYRLNQEWKQHGKSVRFYPSVRSDLKEAKKIFDSRHAEKDPEMLTAVFELEADEGGMLGLAQKDPESTCWNGLSLAAYYNYKDSIDEDGQATQFCRRLEPHIARDSSKLSAEFGTLYGQLLIMKHEYERAKTWLANTYYCGREQLSEQDITECGIYLYKARIRLDEKDIDELAQELETRIKKLKDYQTHWLYAFFVKCTCAYLLECWQEGEPVPGSLQETLADFQKIADQRHEKGLSDQFQSLYFSAIYANRTGNVSSGKQTLEKLSEVLNSYCEKSDASVRSKQAFWIQYHQQRLYHALLADDRETVLDTAERLLNYPHRKSEGATKKYKNIRQAYQETDHPDINKHQLWGTLWY